MKEKPVDKMHDIPAKRISVVAAREAARAKLRDAGALATNVEIPLDVVPVSDEELEQLGAMRPGARPSEEIIAKDRGR